MAAELPVGAVNTRTAPDELEKLFREGTPERYVIKQMREIYAETWKDERVKKGVITGMALALHMIALREE